MDSGAGEGTNIGCINSKRSTPLSNCDFFQSPTGSKATKEVKHFAKGTDATVRIQARAIENMSIAMKEKSQILRDQMAMQLFCLFNDQITNPDAKVLFCICMRLYFQCLRSTTGKPYQVIFCREQIPTSTQQSCIYTTSTSNGSCEKCSLSSL